LAYVIVTYKVTKFTCKSNATQDVLAVRSL